MMRSNIEAERARKKWTQAQISKLLGISPKTYANYIRGTAIPSDVLVKMANLFNCSTDYLLDVQNKSA